MIDFKKRNKKTLLPKSDPTSEKIKDFAGSHETTQVLYQAQSLWESLDQFRRARIRNREYYFGNQWKDKIYDTKTGTWITEEDNIRIQGKVPLQNNLIRQLGKTVIGQYRSNKQDSVCFARDSNESKVSEMLSTILQYVQQVNLTDELDARALEEFLISGCVFQKIRYYWRTGIDKAEVWFDNVHPSRIFFDKNMEDPRHWDCSIIGEIHDVDAHQLLGMFGSDKEKAFKILAMYQNKSLYEVGRYNTLSARRFDNMDFFEPTEGMFRVIEVWRKENKPRYRCHDLLNGEQFKIETDEKKYIDAINENRIKEAFDMGVDAEDVPIIEIEWYIDSFWYYRFITPFSEVIDEGETPYWHKEHPYAFKLYPFLDGEVKPFVDDVIPQQRYINRMITLLDFIINASAKGVLLMPEDCLIDSEMTLDEIAEEWAKHDGVILYRPRPGMPLPQQISAKSTDIGINEQIQMQMRLIEDISGVHSSLQGAQAKSGTAASLYAQQAQNSAVNLVDIFESFKGFRKARDYKALKLIQQYYTSSRYVTISGIGYTEESKMYDPNKVRNVEFDISIDMSTSTSAYSMVVNDMLMNLFDRGAINVRMLLENANLPFAGKILQSLDAMEAQIQQNPMQQAQTEPMPENL